MYRHPQTVASNLIIYEKKNLFVCQKCVTKAIHSYNDLNTTLIYNEKFLIL